MAMTSFARIDAKSFAATKASGFISAPGCGKCMTALTAEATETECLPLAQSLLRHGLANSVLGRLAAAKQKSDLTCVIYEPTDDQDGSMGRCGQYESRPVMCRLFGSLGELSQVGTQIDLTQARILADELLRLRSSSENPSEQKPMPINEALSRALSLELTKSMHEDATEEAEDEGIAQLELKQWAAARVAAKEAAKDLWKEDHPMLSQRSTSIGRPSTSKETYDERSERAARLKGPWRRTHYELYHWLSPLAELTRGHVQDEMVDKLALGAIPSSSSLGTATSVAMGAWPRDSYMEGAARSFTFAAAPDPSMVPVLEVPLLLHEIPYEGAGVGHSVWDSAVVLTIFLRSRAGRLLLADSVNGLADGKADGLTGRQLPRVLELGAGLGLPGRDLAARGAATVILSDSRERLLEQLDQGTSANAIKLNWNTLGDVATAVLAKYDVVIASDVAYYHPDVAPLADALRSMNAAISVIVAPMHRDAALALSDELHARGGTVVELAMTLVSSDADWQGPIPSLLPSLCEAVSHVPTLAYRVLLVKWPQASSPIACSDATTE